MRDARGGSALDCCCRAGKSSPLVESRQPSASVRGPNCCSATCSGFSTWSLRSPGQQFATSLQPSDPRRPDIVDVDVPDVRSVACRLPRCRRRTKPGRLRAAGRVMSLVCKARVSWLGHRLARVTFSSASAGCLSSASVSDVSVLCRLARPPGAASCSALQRARSRSPAIVPRPRRARRPPVVSYL